MEAKEEIRARLAIEDIIGEYVDLKRAGRNFKGLSPFTGEKTPSFYVSPEKNIWHDFSSNKGGDVFSFVMEVEGLDFRGALELLARRAGVELADYESKGAQEMARLKKRLMAAHDLAVQYYQQTLVKNQSAVEYVFKQRGLSKQIVQDFRIGYSPDNGDALVRFLTKKGYSKQELAKAGLTNRYGGDLFRGRMMVPLMDGSGQVIGFTARVLRDEPNAPKYLNTPQTLLYDKSRHVFGLSLAKEAIRAANYSVVVEGNLDVVSSHQVGINQVVATAGTAMTEHHLKSLVRLSPNIRLAFDGDAAGLAATERAIPIAEAVGAELSIISLPEGAKDPDELIKQEVEAWQRAIDKAEPVIDWVLRQHSGRHDLSSAKGKREYTTVALRVIRSLKDQVEREHYLRQVAADVSTSVESLQRKLDEGNDEPDKTRKKIIQTASVATVDPFGYQDNLLAMALTDEDARRAVEELEESMLATPERKAVLEFLKQAKGIVSEVPSDLQNYDTYVKILLLKADARYGQWDDKDRRMEMASLVRMTKQQYQKQTKQQLMDELRSAEDIGDDETAERIRKQLNELIKESRSA